MPQNVRGLRVQPPDRPHGHPRTGRGTTSGRDVTTGPGCETRGIHRIPDAERTSSPATFSVIFLGASVGLGGLGVGWLGITFGLDIVATISAIAVGTLLGQVLLVPLIVIGSRTATNNATSSGATFGVRGRLIGSVIGLGTALFCAALTVWTGASAGVAAAGRLFGLLDGPGVEAAAYALIAGTSATVAIWGYRWLVRSTAILTVVGGLLLILLLFAFADRITWDYPGGQYLLDTFWPTWLSVMSTTGVAGALVFGTVLGDWTRYVRSDLHPARSLARTASAAVFVGLVGPAAAGAAVATAFPDPFAPFTVNLANESPTWFAVLLLPLAVLGGVGLVAAFLYSAGLDLAALVVRISRAQATVLVGVGGVALVYLGLLDAGVQDSVSAAMLAVAELGAPWAALVGVAFLQTGGRYDADDLQVANRGRTGGRYWYSGGWHRAAALAWAAGSTAGLLTVRTTLYTGPLANIAGGVDISLFAGPAVAAALYLTLTLRPAGAPAGGHRP